VQASQVAAAVEAAEDVAAVQAMEAAETAEVEAAIKAADLTEASLGVARAVQEAEMEEPTEATEALSGVALREALAGFLGAHPEAIGYSRGEVHARFAATASAEVDRLLSELVSEGDAFTTIDDDHFCVV